MTRIKETPNGDLDIIILDKESLTLFHTIIDKDAPMVSTLDREYREFVKQTGENR